MLQLPDVVRVVWVVVCRDRARNKRAVGVPRDRHKRPARPVPAVEAGSCRVLWVEDAVVDDGDLGAELARHERHMVPNGIVVKGSGVSLVLSLMTRPFLEWFLGVLEKGD